ncbi:MAG: hypothetical protein WAM78_12280 [Candidatus Sulfotelmatobacter sp.]
MSPVLSARIRRLLLRFVAGVFLLALGVSTLAYAADYVVFRYRVAEDRQPFGQITVSRYYAVAQKSGKTQFIFQPPEAQTCVHSLFPRAGCVPCWYLQRHTEQRTDI